MCFEPLTPELLTFGELLGGETLSDGVTHLDGRFLLLAVTIGRPETEPFVSFDVVLWHALRG